MTTDYSKMTDEELFEEMAALDATLPEGIVTNPERSGTPHNEWFKREISRASQVITND